MEFTTKEKETILQGLKALSDTYQKKIDLSKAGQYTGNKKPTPLAIASKERIDEIDKLITKLQ